MRHILIENFRPGQLINSSAITGKVGSYIVADGSQIRFGRPIVLSNYNPETEKGGVAVEVIAGMNMANKKIAAISLRDSVHHRADYHEAKDIFGGAEDNDIAVVIKEGVNVKAHDYAYFELSSGTFTNVATNNLFMGVYVTRSALNFKNEKVAGLRFNTILRQN